MRDKCPRCGATPEGIGWECDSVPSQLEEGYVIESKDCLRRQIAALQALLDDHGPDGRNVTNRQFTELRLKYHELREALVELVALKDEVKQGDPADYERRKPAAWQAARAALRPYQQTEVSDDA